MLGTTDWLMKRFLKFVLKRNVGKYLSSEIDLEQLDVKLDTGKLELKNLLLNCDALNRDLTLGSWHVKAGYVGSVIAKLPLVSLSSAQCSVVVSEVMLTLAPTPCQPSGAATTSNGPAQDGGSGSTPAAIFPQDIPSSAPASTQTQPSAAGGAMGFLLADDFGWTGHGAVMEGIKRIAGSLQSMLQHMRVEASNVLIRVELPHPTEKGRVVTAALKLDVIEFGDLSSSPAAVTGAAAAGGQQQHTRQQHHHHHHHKASCPGPRPHGGGAADGSGGLGSGGTTASAATSAAEAGASARREIAKLIQVKGLSLDLFETTPLITGAAVATSTSCSGSPLRGPQPVASAGAAANAASPLSSSSAAAAPTTNGSSGVTLVSGPGKHGLQLSAELRMTIPDDATQPTQIAADLHVGAVRLQLLPSHAICLSALQAALNGSAAAAAFGASEAGDAQGTGSGAAPDLWASSYGSGAASMHSAAGHWGRRSLLESIMLPNCEDVVVHSLEPYVAGAGLYGDASEFHDACSRFGSLASSLVSSVTQKGSDLLGYVAASGSAAVGGAMDWISAAPQSPPRQPPPAAAAPMGPELQPALAASGATASAAAAAGFAVPAAAGGAKGDALTGSRPLPPVVSVRAELSQAAVVLCYGAAAAAPHASHQHQQHSHGAAHRNSAHAGASRHTVGSGLSTSASRRAGMGPAGGALATATTPTGSAAATTPGGTQAAGGSMVLELHDLSCELWLDAAHGNGAILQAGQLQVYEQLPAAVGALYGMTSAEWSRVPEVLPQAPYRFRPSQPSPARASLSGSSAGAALSPRLGMRPPGRNAQQAASGASGGAGAALHVWPILSCACTAAHGACSAGHGEAAAAASGASQHKAAGGNRQAAQASAVAGGGAGHGPGSGGQGCLRLRALWGSCAAPDYAAAGGGYGRYGSDTYAAVQSFDFSLEVLPVTVWLSLPMVQRVTDFAAPLAGEATRIGGGSPGKRQPAAPRPAALLPRLSLTVVAPHVCVLLALVPPRPPAVPVPRTPGSPVFVALDIVSPPHMAPDSHSHAPPPPHLSHSQQPQHHHHYPQLAHGPPQGFLGSSPYGSYGNVAHAPYSGSYAPYGGAQQNHATHGGGAWGAHPGHTPGGHAYQHGGAASPYYSGAHGPHHGPGGWSAAAAVPLLALFQAPATDRLIPSQVTTVDLAPGIVELFLVRTAAGSSATSAAGAPHGDAVGPQQHVTSGVADPSGVSSWTSKLLFSLHPSRPPLPPAATTCRTPWDAPHAAPPTGPWDVPPGCGLHLHVCSDPGVGTAEELVPEAWGHVAGHAQDRWADPDGEGGAWEERSSFRSVAFHERCRKSSANFVHLRAPQALVHLTRGDIVDIAALQSILLSDPDAAATTARSGAAPGGAAHAGPKTTPGLSWATSAPAAPAERLGLDGPTPQTCALLEVCLRIQLQDEPSSSPSFNTPHAPSSATSSVAAHGAAAPGCGSAPHFGAMSTAPATSQPQALPPGGQQAPPCGGAGLGLGGSRVVVYELLVEELTVFRANHLGAQPGCNVTSAHAHGVTLMGHLEQPPPPHPPPPPQQQHSLSPTAPAQGAGCGSGASAAAAAVSASAGNNAAPGATPRLGAGPGAAGPAANRPRTVGPAQGHPGGLQPQGAAAAGTAFGHRHPQHQQGQPHNHGSGSGSAGSQPAHRAGAAASAVLTPAPAICLLHCPRSLGAAERAPSYIEYVCVEGRQPGPALLAAPSVRGSGGGASSGWGRQGAAAEPPPAAAPETAIHSVLLQGLTVSTDHGYVTLDWAVQLGALFESVAAAVAASPPGENQAGAAARQPHPQGLQQGREGFIAAAQAPTGAHRTASSSSAAAAAVVGAAGKGRGPGPRGRLSINIVDLALRHEPMEYPTTAGPGAAGVTAGLQATDPTYGGAGATAHAQPQAQLQLRPGASGSASGAAAASGSGGINGSTAGRVSPVALALIVEAVHFGLPLGLAAEQVPYNNANTPPPTHTMELHSMTLHLAAADQRGPGWGAGDPRAVREPLLQACGYHRVLQETSIKVVAKQRRYPRRPRPPADPVDGTGIPAPATFAATASRNAAVATSTEPFITTTAAFPGYTDAHDKPQEYHSTLDVEVTNQHLLGMLTVESATLLAHFAMQAGTLMTARQAAAVTAAAAASGAPIRRDGTGGPASGVPADLYWDAASEASSSSAAAGLGSTVGVSCSSEAGGDAAGSLLTALLLDEVDENAFRMVPEPAASLVGGVAGSLTASGVVHGLSGGWYGDGAASEGGGGGDGAGHNGLILIDDFFPVNHQGEYDEDLMLVQHPPKDGRGGWRNGENTELEGTWYGPDDGPDRRPTSAAAAAAAPAPALPGYDPAVDAAAAEDYTYGSHHCGLRFGNGEVLGCVEGLCGGEDGDDMFTGGMERGVASEDPDIDDLLAPGGHGPAPGLRLGQDPRVGAGGISRGEVARAPMAPSVVSVGSAAVTRSSSVPTWRLQEDYVRVPRKSDEDGTGSGGVGAAGVGGLGGAGASSSVDPMGGIAAGGAGGVDQPPPVTRITFKDLSGIWVMHTTRSSSSSGPASCGSTGAAGPQAAAGGPAAAGAAGGSSPSGHQEGRVEVVIEGLNLVLESYGPGGHLARHMKFTVHDLEIRDCVLDVRQQQAAAAGGLALATGGGGRGSGGGGWVRVLGYRAVRGKPRDSRAPLVALALTAVRPNPAACDPRDEEFRLAVALLPLRLKLNQDVMSYLTWYGTSVSNSLKPAAAVLNGMQASLSELGGCEPLPPPYFQRAQIRGFTIMLDYRPRRVDIGALAEGRLLELLNLVPLGGVDLACKPLRLAGVQGWDGLGAAVLREWLNDIARMQAHKFITGLAPVNAVVKVGSAVATLLAAPARHYARRDAAAGRQLAAQLRRTSATFATRLVCEALNAGKKAGKALARVGSNALGATYGSQASLHVADASYYGHDKDGEDGGGAESEGEEGEYGEGRADGDKYGSLYGTAAGGGGGGEAAGHMRRSRSASAVVCKGLARAAWRLGSASQQVAAGLQSGGLQRGMSNMARVLSAAAATGVSAAAPASAAFQGQLQGTLRGVRRALRAQLLHQGGSGGGTAAGLTSTGPQAGGAHPPQPRLKED